MTDARIRLLIRRGCSLERIASACQSTTSETWLRIQRILREDRERGRKPTDPGVQEIEQACEEIQRDWCETEREKAYVGSGRSWRPVVVPASILTLARD